MMNDMKAELAASKAKQAASEAKQAASEAKIAEGEMQRAEMTVEMQLLRESKTRSNSSRSSAGSVSPRPRASDRSTREPPGAGTTAGGEGATGQENQGGAGHRVKLERFQMTGTDDPTGSGTAAGNDERRSTPLLSPTGGGITGATRQSAHTARALPFSGPDQHLQAADHIGDLGSIQAPTPVNPQHSLQTIINTTVFADSTTAVSRVARTAGGGASGEM
jgi:hypothetical protein